MLIGTIICLTLSVMAVSAAADPQSTSGRNVILGVYGSPQAFWQKGWSLREHHVNAVFVHSSEIDDGLIKHARAEGCLVFAEFATLNGQGYVEQHPEAWPVDETGKKSPPQSWFMGACPTDEGFLRYRLEALEKLVRQFDVDGVWLDYLHWHNQFEEPEPMFVHTCFNESCLNRFERETGIHPQGHTTAEKAHWILSRHEKEWNDWRCSILADWARRCREIVRRYRPGALLGNYQCPWRDEEFNRALWRYMGIDLDRLAKEFDVVSPMVYHGRMGRPTRWAAGYVRWLGKRLHVRSNSKGLQIWPIVQAYSDPQGAIVTPEEFREALRGGMTAPARGVMMFTTGALAAEPEKASVMREVYQLLHDSLK